MMARPRKPAPPPPSGSVRARLTGVGGARANGAPDVAAIAARVGRSPRTVQRWLASGALPKGAEERVRDLERVDAHRPRWIEAKDEGATARGLLGDKERLLPAVQDVRGSLLAAFRRKDGTLDTRRAADELGVSQRTVQRWAKGQTRPKIQHQDTLRKSVRSSMVEGRRGARQVNQGALVQVTAVVAISGDVRQRRIGHQSGIRLSGQDMAVIQQAYAKGGDAAATRALSTAIARSTYGRQSGMHTGSIRAISEARFTR